MSDVRVLLEYQTSPCCPLPSCVIISYWLTILWPEPERLSRTVSVSMTTLAAADCTGGGLATLLAVLAR